MPAHPIPGPVAAACVAALLLAGCTSAVDTSAPWCARQHVERVDGADVVVCDQLHAAEPFLRAPKAPSGHAYAATQGAEFVTAEGARYPVPESGEGGEGGFADREHQRHAVAVYDLVLSGGKVVKARPAVLLPESVFVAPFLGKAAEGTISARVGEGEFALEPSLPVRLAIAPQPAAEAKETDKPGREIVVTVQNLDKAVTAGSGRCLPALASHGAASPFPAGAKVELRGYRVPWMHGVGDDQYVLALFVDGEPRGSTMARGWYRGPSDLLRGGAPAPFAAYEGVGHGSPGSIPTLHVALAAGGGGEPCTPRA